MKKSVLNEWMWTLTAPGAGRRSPIMIEVENVRPQDQAFVSALVKLATIWLNATGRRSA